MPECVFQCSHQVLLSPVAGSHTSLAYWAVMALNLSRSEWLIATLPMNGILLTKRASSEPTATSQLSALLIASTTAMGTSAATIVSPLGAKYAPSKRFNV